ncbi:uncharacterized protein LOC101889983 [Musca domestica]|uniref:Uncharacterized protein LOC101889983 n=1 Tax=Musca domestica TaxID=7370 RepID=A0A9J7CU63_MUSDO|nr:uncharacterized protein LOC101889983 [Musca domestica]
MFNKSLYNFFILGVFALIAIVKAQDDYGLANTILSSVSSVQYDPSRSQQCFSVYLPKLNDITNEYEAQYQECLDKSANSQYDVRNEVAPAADSVSSTVQQICGAFNDCDFGEDPSGFFSCSNDAAVRATSQAYGVQTLAQDRVQYIKLKYEQIQYSQNVCSSNASDIYVKDTAMVHAQLQDCLAGKEPETTTGSNYIVA